MSMQQIVINVSGGLVQDVFCSDPHVSLAVVDWDTEGCYPAEPGVVEVPLEHRLTSAWVGECEAVPLTKLIDTDVERALQVAGIELPRRSARSYRGIAT
jgi:hypothetical protein